MHLELYPNDPLGAAEEEEEDTLPHLLGTAKHLELYPNNPVESSWEEEQQQQDTLPSVVGTASHLELYPNEPLGSSTDAGNTTTITATNKINTASNTNFVVQDIEESPLTSSVNNVIWYYCIAAVSFLIVAILCRRTFINSRRRYRNRKRQNTLLNLFHYLKPFDVEDVDVKSSATGGFHCTYLGNIAQGGDVRDDASTGSSSTGSSPVHDRPSLFSSSSLNVGDLRKV